MLSKASLQCLQDQFPAFQTLSADSRNQIAREGQLHRLAAGSVLFEDGMACRSFPLVLSGRLRITQTADNGREMVLYRLHPGEMCLISASCLFGSTPYTASGIADTDLEIIAFSPELFNTLTAQDAAFRAFVFKLFTERLHDMMLLVEAVAFQRLDQRLAVLLLTKGDSIQETHQHLADELGSVREMVSRLLRRFEEQGIVTLGREHISIVNPIALQKIATP